MTRTMIDSDFPYVSCCLFRLFFLLSLVIMECPAISEEIVDELILEKQNKMSGESNTPDCGEKCDSVKESETLSSQDYKSILVKFCDKLEVLINEFRKEIDAQ